MDFLPDSETLSHWLIHYGSFALFALLAVGIIALPVPEETLMVIAGVLMETGHLPIFGTILAAYGGSMCGITASYLIGRTAGTFFIQKYGGYVGIHEKQMNIAHRWFERFGKWSLAIGYFIPGVRHFTGLIAGMTKLEYPVFAVFAYPGAILWVSTFLSVGFFFGNYCLSVGNYCLEVFENIEFSFETLFIIAASIALVGFLVYLYRKRRSPL